ncbi:hypothetical protein [Aureibacillus halotolerans]|uniref:Uncharacterized protein n=1 Tax=Aureibacillus halotolerans TaxID=1508390 RepID=A0A4R6U8V7_9BACI|nr:hypothetical protein [Aureibacillus halotolerans]TDQ43008.1 hypothetical protein EV213_101440 [Aureibacillus halotolerans]
MFDHESASIAKRIFRNLFQNAPEHVERTGEYWNDDNGDGHFDTITCCRDEIVQLFDKLVSFSEKLADKTHYLYHCGI